MSRKSKLSSWNIVKIGSPLKITRSLTYPSSSSYTLGPPLTKRLSSPSFDGVVVPVPAVVGVKELLEPLEELKVVLELRLHQLVNLNALKEIRFLRDD